MKFGDFLVENVMVSDVPTSQISLNINVFIRFHFFMFFIILVSPGGPWDLILSGLGVLGAPFW